MTDSNADNVVSLFGNKAEKKSTDFNKVSELLEGTIKDIYANLGDDDKEDFKNFLSVNHPAMAITVIEDGIDFSSSIDTTKIEEDIDHLQSKTVRALELISELHAEIIECNNCIDLVVLDFIVDSLEQVVKGIKDINSI